MKVLTSNAGRIVEEDFQIYKRVTSKKGEDALNSPTNTQFVSDYEFFIDGSNLFVFANGYLLTLTTHYTIIDTLTIQLTSACCDSDNIELIVLTSFELTLEDIVESISDLRLWLTSSNLELSDGTEMSAWEDTSDNSNDVIQSSSGQYPKCKTNIQNSLPAILFDGNDYFYKASTDNLNLGTSDFSVTIAVYYSGSGCAYPILISNNPGGWSSGAVTIAIDHAWCVNKIGMSVSDYSSGGMFLTSTTTLTYNQWYIVTLVRSGNFFYLYLNNALEAQNSFSGSVNWSQGNGFRVAGGNWDGGNSYFAGYLSEVIIYGVAISSTERTALYNYLKERWDI
jgi:hypothetical protein